LTVVVIDTNILAYLLIAGDRTKEAQALYRQDPEWKSEAFLLVEFSNLLATCVRNERLTRSRSERVLAEAQSRISGFVQLPHQTALRIANELGISAYDARFLAAAEALNAELVTEDAKLRASAPGRTRSLEEALV
jgi:predicted nucleic acid-binding protein